MTWRVREYSIEYFLPLHVIHRYFIDPEDSDIGVVSEFRDTVQADVRR
jgi:hypothetical protein